MELKRLVVYINSLILIIIMSCYIDNAYAQNWKLTKSEMMEVEKEAIDKGVLLPTYNALWHISNNLLEIEDSLPERDLLGLSNMGFKVYYFNDKDTLERICYVVDRVEYGDIETWLSQYAIFEKIFTQKFGISSRKGKKNEAQHLSIIFPQDDEIVFTEWQNGNTKITLYREIRYYPDTFLNISYDEEPKIPENKISVRFEPLQ